MTNIPNISTIHLLRWKNLDEARSLELLYQLLMHQENLLAVCATPPTWSAETKTLHFWCDSRIVVKSFPLLKWTEEIADHNPNSVEAVAVWGEIKIRVYHRYIATREGFIPRPVKFDTL